MLDPETFLVELYVLADACDKAHLPPERRRGRPPALARSEVLTLALFGQWACLPSERAFDRWAARHLRPFFPPLPARPQFNRRRRQHGAAITAFAVHLGQTLAARDRSFEILDGTGVAVRNAKRRGAGWLFGLADIGKCARLGWFEGMRLLLSLSRHGAITGWASAPASTNDRTVAEAFFAQRAAPDPSRIWASVAPNARWPGRTTTAPWSSVRPKPAARRNGPNRASAGWRVCAKSSRRSTTGCCMTSAWSMSGRTPSMAGRRA